MSQSEDTVSTYVAASPETVWRLVSDVTNMGRWSPECYRAFWVGRRKEPVAGARFLGLNRDGWIRWVGMGTVTAATPGREFTFRASPSGVVWRYTMQPAEGGTTLTEQRDTAGQRTGLVKLLYAGMGGYPRRMRVLRTGMATTIARVKDAAESLDPAR